MKIMFICTGNICRSAMAHHLFEKMVRDNNKNIEVYSCGIYAENGDGATYNAIEVMKDYDVDLSIHKSTNIRKSNILNMDLILCATMGHKHAVLKMYPELNGKVYTIKEYSQYDEKGLDIDINDPWGYDIETYRQCAREINECLELLIKKI